ncbi:MAG: DUF2061 domain-containing protein [Candidatus Endolissoclinum sp.]|nr:DUF2061 domain-containing protein [Candidatus Endolissoclinum sp.]
MKALHIHLYKSLSYRLLSICITFIISFILTGSMALAGSIASIDALIKFVVYFLHERAWGKVFKRIKKKKRDARKLIKHREKIQKRIKGMSQGYRNQL